MRRMEITILSVEVEYLDNAGCNNGNYPAYTVVTSAGTYSGKTCRCGHGCSGTDRLPEIGMVFAGSADLDEYVAS